MAISQPKLRKTRQTCRLTTSSPPCLKKRWPPNFPTIAVGHGLPGTVSNRKGISFI